MGDIKTIDEHKWSDGNIARVDIGTKHISIEGSFNEYVHINNEDLAVLVNAKGYDIVKRQSGDKG